LRRAEGGQSVRSVKGGNRGQAVSVSSCRAHARRGDGCVTPRGVLYVSRQVVSTEAWVTAVTDV